MLSLPAASSSAMRARSVRPACPCTGPSTASSMSSTAETGSASRTVEARNASSAARTSSSVHERSSTSSQLDQRARG